MNALVLAVLIVLGAGRGGIAEEEELISAASYGVVGDGATTCTNNDDALIELRDDMLADPSKTYRIVFEPGHYCYENNQWLRGVEAYILDGGSFENVNDAAQQYIGSPFFPGDPFGDFIVDGVGYTGHLIDSAAVNDSTVTLATAAESSNYAIGDRILIHGYDQQAFTNFPPNLRYFEYKTITNVVGGTGVITLDSPLVYKYDDRWPDGDNNGLTIGKPRILSMDQAGYVQPRHVEFRGVTIIENRETPTASSLITPADRVIYQDVTAPVIWFGLSDVVTVDGCTAHYIEPDKFVNSLTISDCDVDGEALPYGVAEGFAVGSAVGVNHMAVTGSNIVGRWVLGPRELIITDSHLYSSPPDTWLFGIIAVFASYSTTTLSVGNVTFHNETPDFDSMINTAFLLSMEVDDVGAGGEMLIPWVGGEAGGIAWAARLQYGHLLTRNPAGKSGVVTELYHDGGSPGNLVIEGTWATPVTGEIYTFWTVEHPIDTDGNTVVGTQIPIWGLNPERVE